MKPIVLNTRELNPIAEMNRNALRSAGVFAVSVWGGPGCGKTSLIDETIRRLAPGVRIGVIACDVSSHVDADRMNRHSEQVVQVNTGVSGIAEAADVHEAIRCLDLNRLDVLFIENVGTLIGPIAADLGQDVSVAMFSVAGGDDKADKHPELVRAANLVVLSKTDLLPNVPFNLEGFRASVHRLNPAAELFEVSALQGAGTPQWADWLKSRVKRQQKNESSEWYG